MIKRKYTDKELDLLDKLKHENKKLKRELKAARKTLDRYIVAEKIGLFDGEKVIPSKKRKEVTSIYERWSCHDCGKGCLEIILIGNRYIRQCNECGKRTKSQIIHDELVGIKNGEVYKKKGNL